MTTTKNFDDMSYEELVEFARSTEGAGAKAVDANLEPPGTPWDRKKGLPGEVPSRQSICDLNMKEHLEAVETGKQLARVRDLLVKQDADDKLIDAIDQAIADNEFWMLSDPHPDGDSTDQDG